MQTYLAQGYDWERTRPAEFIRRYGYRSLADLQAGSAKDPSTFWTHVADYLDLVWTSPYQCVLDLTDGPRWPKWFAGGEFDLFDHLVGCWARLFPDKVALRWEGDWGETRDITYASLLDESSRLAEGPNPLAPQRVHLVGGLPKTRNGKAIRRLVKHAYLGRELGDLSSLENPCSLDFIKLIRVDGHVSTSGAAWLCSHAAPCAAQFDAAQKGLSE